MTQSNKFPRKRRRNDRSTHTVTIIDLLCIESPLRVVFTDVYCRGNNEIQAYKASALSKSGIEQACLRLIVTENTWIIRHYLCNALKIPTRTTCYQILIYTYALQWYLGAEYYLRFYFSVVSSTLCMQMGCLIVIYHSWLVLHLKVLIMLIML